MSAPGTGDREQFVKKKIRRWLAPVPWPLAPEKGVTLIEMMITVALSSVVVGGMAVMMSSYSRMEKLTRARLNAQQNVRVYLDLMVKMLREAQSSTVVVDQVSGEAPWSRISFTTIEGTTITYYQGPHIEGKKALFQTVNGTTRRLADNLRTLKFTYPSTDDTNIIGVSLCFEETVYGTQTNVLHLSVEKVRLMN